MNTTRLARLEWSPFLIAVAAVAAAGALRIWPLHVLGARFAWVTFYPAVIAVALYGGAAPGLAATTLSCLAVWIVLPFVGHQPFMRDAADWLGLAVFAVTCAVITGICEGMRRARARERQAAEERDRFFALSLDMLCISNSDGYFKRLSPAFTDTLGWSVEEILARPFLDFVHPDDVAATLDAVQKQVVAGEKILHFENRYRHKDGSWRVLSWRSVPQPGGFMYATARDVTEIRRAQAAQLLLAAIVESSDDAIVSMTLDGTVTSWNAGAERLFSYSAAEMVGSPIARIVPLDRLDEEMGILDHLRSGEHGLHFDTVRVGKDGRPIEVSATISPVRDQGERVVGASKTLRDISERNRLIRDLEAANKRLEALKGDLEAEVAERTAAEQRVREVVESAPHAMVIVDRTGTITLVNSQTLAWFRYAREELIGQSVELLIPDRYRQHHPEYVSNFFRAPARRPMGSGRELFGRRKDGSEFPVDISLGPVNTSDGPQVIASIWDITSRKDAERDLSRANQAFETANKDLEAFAYSVSHDLRAPLRGVNGFSRILLEDYGPKLDDEGRRLLNVVRGEAQRMGQLIDDLLAFSRVGRQELKATNCDLTALAQSVFESLDQQARSRVRQFELRPLPPAYGDLALLRQVLFNLLANAVKFTGRQPAPTIEVGGSTGNGMNTYYVKDNGSGFDPQYAHKLFGVFQRLHSDEEFEGTGVGLALVKRIVERHGGEIRAEGKLNEGATFTFTLPVGKGA